MKSIDYIIAKYIFNYAQVGVRPETIYSECGSEWEVPRLKILIEVYDDGSGENWEICPRYSSDMNSAMLVVKQLQTMDNCCIDFSMDVPGDVWRVEIKGNHNDCTSKALIDGIEELPMAICLAALKSLDDKKHYIKARAIRRQEPEIIEANKQISIRRKQEREERRVAHNAWLQGFGIKNDDN